LPFLQDEGTDTQPIEDTGLEFPDGNLFELENRVFTNSWSIPYKKEESLGKCLLASTRLAQEGLELLIAGCTFFIVLVLYLSGLMESHNSCKRFLDKCMPECFHKVCIY
jgi:ubiquitin carboxyl-terminal hydrolase 9/24